MAKILLVDDLADIRKSNANFMYVCNSNLEIQEASDAQEGLELLAQNTYDAIISDYNMPGIDGLAFYDKVQELGISTPFYLLTARSIPEDRLPEGLAGYMQKGQASSKLKEIAKLYE